MADMTRINRVSKDIYKSGGEIKVKHVVRLNSKKDDKYNSPFKFVNEFKAGDMNYLIFSTFDQIIIESMRQEHIVDTRANGGKYVPPPRLYISYMEAPLFIISIDRIITWLTSKSKDVFEADNYGSPKSIKQPNLTEIVPVSFQQRAIFEPTIVYDNHNVAYQGIKLSNSDALMGNFTAQEFLEFALAIKYVLMNLYQNSNMLTMMGMMYMMNMKESQ